jgi:hypothetical protein
LSETTAATCIAVGKDIVAALAPVHVVVRVDQAPFPALAAHELARPVGEDLVHVHVRLRAGARLPDNQREFVRPLAGENFIGGR